MNWKSTVTLVVLLLVLLGAAFYGWQTIIDPVTADDDTAATVSPTRTSPTCRNEVTYHKGDIVKAKSVTVNVFNAGEIPDLAGTTLDELHANGFKMGVAVNAPPGFTATNVTIVTRTPDSPEIRLVKKMFAGKVRVVAGRDIRSGVDVLVGNAFKRVVDKAHARVKIHKTKHVCTVSR